MKFYLCDVWNKVYSIPYPHQNKMFIKFGVTHHKDVAKRFDASVDDGYTKNYDDWIFSCQFSMWCDSREEAESIEQYWLKERFPNPGPNKVWVENLLECPTNNYYDNASGITELRLVTKYERYQILQELYKMKENRNGI